MRKLLIGTLLGTAIGLSSPESISSFDHEKTIHDIKKRTGAILELKEKKSKILRIQEAIDKDIDSNETRVLLIGIGDYKYIDGLETPINDIKMMKKFLMKKYGIKKENITVLIDEKATKTRILEMMKKIEIETPDDKKMIIYFSGHGIALDSEGREVTDYTKTDYTGYITPYDGTKYSKKLHNEKKFMQSRISRYEINNAIGFKQNNLLILDSCFGGAMAKKSGENEVLVTASNKEIAVATRNSRYKTSLFSKAVFENLTGKNPNSLGGAVIKSGENVNIQANVQNSPQEPIVKAKTMTYNLRQDKLEEIKN